MTFDRDIDDRPDVRNADTEALESWLDSYNDEIVPEPHVNAWFADGVAQAFNTIGTVCKTAQPINGWARLPLPPTCSTCGSHILQVSSDGDSWTWIHATPDNDNKENAS